MVILPILIICIVKVLTNYVEKGYCPESEDCTWRFPYFVTQNLKCISKYQCPLGFLCCSDCHYEHKVCKAAVWIWIDDGCPKDREYCDRPVEYAKTKLYECTSHHQCSTTDLCCPDSCYTHKVCKSAYQHVHKPEYVCPVSLRKELCPNTNRTLNKYACKKDEDCFPGYVCCQDNCYDHTVCKFPKDALSYRNVYKPSSYTTSPSVEEQYKCPEINQKCSKPYSLRLAKNFICFKDEDCKLGQLCCKDSCVKDFRICKDLFTLKPQLEVSSTKEWTTAFNSTVDIPMYNKEQELLTTAMISFLNNTKLDKNVEIVQQKPLQLKEADFYFPSELESGSGFDFEPHDQED